MFFFCAPSYCLCKHIQWNDHLVHRMCIVWCSANCLKTSCIWHTLNCFVSTWIQSQDRLDWATKIRIVWNSPLCCSPITGTDVYPWIGPESHTMASQNAACSFTVLFKQGRDSATLLQGNRHSHAPLATTSPVDEEKCVCCCIDAIADIWMAAICPLCHILWPQPMEGNTSVNHNVWRAAINIEHFKQTVLCSLWDTENRHRRERGWSCRSCNLPPSPSSPQPPTTTQQPARFCF